MFLFLSENKMRVVDDKEKETLLHNHVVIYTDYI